MNFELSEMQQMLVDSAERLVADHSGVEEWRAHRDHADGVDRALWSTMAELGWLALAIPEDAGGLGGSLDDVALLMIELGRGLIVEPIVSTAVLAAHVLDKAATGERRDELLGSIASGKTRIALAHSEPSMLADFSGPRKTTAHSAAGGYVLDGSKMLVIDGPSADKLLISAQLDGNGGLGIFLVDANAEGLTQTAYPLIDGSRAADFTLSDVTVPADALLTQGGQASTIMAEAIDRARVALVAQSVGVMEACVKTAGDYARERKQFGQPIGNFQAIQHLASDMFVASYQARSALYQALGAFDNANMGRAGAVSTAEVIAAESGQTVGRNGIQIHGGYGITDEYAVSHYYRRLLSLEKQYGGIDYHLGQLATAAMAG